MTFILDFNMYDLKCFTMFKIVNPYFSTLGHFNSTPYKFKLMKKMWTSSPSSFFWGGMDAYEVLEEKV